MFCTFIISKNYVHITWGGKDRCSWQKWLS